MANAAFLAEKSAKEAAEGKLTTLRRSVAHKDELLKTLKAKVSTTAPYIQSLFWCSLASPGCCVEPKTGWVLCLCLTEQKKQRRRKKKMSVTVS